MFSFLFFPIIFFNAPFISFRFTIFVSFSYKPNLEIIYYYEKIHFSFCRPVVGANVICRS